MRRDGLTPPVRGTDAELGDEDVPKAIDNQPGQCITIRVHEAVGVRDGRVREQPRAKRGSALDALAQYVVRIDSCIPTRQ